MQSLIGRYPVLTVCSDDILKALQLLTEDFASGGCLYICGNGGSAADAEHISGELLKGFMLKRPLAEPDKRKFSRFGEMGTYLAKKLQGSLPAVPLSSLISLPTAVANDNSADMIFAQAVWGLLDERDVLLVISTSGNSKNIIYAAIAARAKGAKVIALTGKTGGQLKQYTDICIRVPETEAYRVQELHLPVYHYICAELEARFFTIKEVRNGYSA